MSRATRWGARLALLAALACAGCAWANRDNRPVWNAFEEHWVPEDETMVWVTAPLTVPAGLVAIVLDIFIVHPVQVMDDAWRDTTELWDDLDWRDDYYTECGLTVLRAPWSVVTLVGSFVARSLFDVPAWEDDDDHDHREGRLAGEPEGPSDAEREAGYLAWLEALLRDPEGALARGGPPRVRTWNDALDAAVRRVLAEGAPVARLRLRREALDVSFLYPERPTFAGGDPDVWIDPDPRVRVALLSDPAFVAFAYEHDRLREALYADDDPVVRALVRQELGDP